MDKIYFTINGEHYSLAGSEVNPDTSLNDYLRQYVNVRGTKVMCREGGCGACIVSVTNINPVTKEKNTFAVNSCLVHILSCHQWDITTIEGVGNRKDGYHSIQTRLVMFNGTQCGFCSPGWVMNMFSLYENKNHNLTTKEIENSFAGNICRCTGYRSILDAFKSMATDTEESLHNRIQDLEDLADMKCLKKVCPKTCEDNKDWCIINNSKSSDCLTIELNANRWYKAFKIEDIFHILSREGVSSYRLVAGNTGKGVFPIKSEARVLIDISSIEALKESTVSVNLILGAALSLADVMNKFKKLSSTDNFTYLTHLHDHLDLVAHVPVRNIGTIGGNLALKNKHHGFPSDIFLLLTTVGATVTIMNRKLDKTDLYMRDFLKTNLNDQLIYDVKLPPLSTNHILKTYKIMPRAQNAHAVMNAGFLFKVDSKNIVKSARIVYGCISPDFINAERTEKILLGVDLYSDETLKKAIEVLEEELIPVNNPPEASTDCRKSLALGLFYKAILSLAPTEKINPRYKSGAAVLERPLSKGTQTFDTDKNLWPLNKPMPKLEALIQCSGEAKYANDVPSYPKEVHVAFVLSTICNGDIGAFDPSEALRIPGVIAFFSAKDIPGKNTFTPTSVLWSEFEEEILATKHVSFYGQPVGLVAAVTENLANKASSLVKVSYENVSSKKPVLTVEDALAAPKTENRVRQEVEIKPSNTGSNVVHTIKGKYNVPSQYHYTMEPQSCVVVPNESHYDVYSATQWMDAVQIAIAGCLNVPENIVNVIVSRVGGGYGGKASRANQVAAACALVASKLNRTSRMVLSIQANMVTVGKRQNCTADYEIGVDKEGLIQYLNLNYYSDCGCSFNDTMGGELPTTLCNLYEYSGWHIVGYSVLTDKASNTWCRSPATTEATAILEHIMERIAHKVGKDSTEIKIMNLSPKHDSIKDMITSFKKDCEFDARLEEIRKFNEANAWRKKAIKLSNMSFPLGYVGGFAVTISVYHGDGSVAVSHGGIEMGQGLNTKVAQVCAYSLHIPMDKVSIKASNTMISPNSMATNGSMTSECLAFATVKACTELLRKMQPSRDELTDPTWEEVVASAYKKGVNLQSTYMMSLNDNLKGYDIYGVTIAEIELDVLTGTHQITRVDILEDTGQSMSPEIDVGQIEGAFIMGVGMWTSENLIFDEATGYLLTDRTWTYKPPGVKDIPVDFRINFKRNSTNPVGVLRSKATGEPSLIMAVVITHALHDAIVEARKEFGYNDTDWVDVDTPYTVDNIMRAISAKTEKFKLV